MEALSSSIFRLSYPPSSPLLSPLVSKPNCARFNETSSLLYVAILTLAPSRRYRSLVKPRLVGLEPKSLKELALLPANTRLGLKGHKDHRI